MRVLADHSRATANLIADGVLPSNLSRGYVLRSIMRARFASPSGSENRLGSSPACAWKSPKLLGDIYPELRKAESLIEKAVNAEDEGFRSTIDRGLRLISETEFAADTAGQKPCLAKVAFQLHDTYGFPLDLTQVIGREQGFVVDEYGFAEEMRKQRERSKFAGSGDQAVSHAYHAPAPPMAERHSLAMRTGATAFVRKARILALIVGVKASTQPPPARKSKS